MTTDSEGRPTHATSPVEALKNLIRAALAKPEQPSAWEVVDLATGALGPKACWDIRTALEELAGEGQLLLFPSAPLSQIKRDYVRSLLDSEDLDAALNGETAPRRAVESTIDALVRQTRAYRSSAAFAEMVEFMTKFRDYAPFNNMLVRLQDPTCGFFATAADWKRRFQRQLKDDARPMVILAPMRPVMLVYALDDTDGPPVPVELQRLSRFEGPWDPEWLTRTVKNAAREQVGIQFKRLSSTNSGFAELRVEDSGNRRLRIVVHEDLDEPSRYGVLCHELAHIYLGHLGSNEDRWWPGRASLSKSAIEFEAEAAAYVVTGRLGLAGSGADYLSRYFKGDVIPDGVSLDLIARVAWRIEQMARENLPPRPPKTRRDRRR